MGLEDKKKDKLEQNTRGCFAEEMAEVWLWEETMQEHLLCLGEQSVLTVEPSRLAQQR
jgi:hypothetical protein